MLDSQMLKNQSKYRASFNRLAELVFGIHFEEWYRRGYWGDRYICHSILHDNGEIIANVSVNRMDLVLNGVNKKGIQIGTVMTHPDFRGKGLSSRLMRYVLSLYENNCDVLYLFANRSVLDFYPGFGFTPMAESQFLLQLDGPPAKDVSLLKLDCSRKEDTALIKRLLDCRIPVSRKFGVINDEGLFMFYALNVFAGHLYYSPKDDAVLVFEHKGEALHLYDIVSSDIIDFDRLLSRISNPDTREIRFHFVPERLTAKAVLTPMDETEDILFVKPVSAFDNMKDFCAPKLSHA